MLVFCCLSYDLSTSWWELAWQPDACTPGCWVLVHRVANAPPTKGYCEVKKWSEVTQSCPTLCDPMDCSPPGSSILGIFQARVLEWVAISYQCWSELSVLCNGCGLSIIYSMSTICLFVIFFFCHAACGILVPHPGIGPGPQLWNCWVLTAEMPGNSSIWFTFIEQPRWPIITEKMSANDSTRKKNMKSHMVNVKR